MFPVAMTKISHISNLLREGRVSSAGGLWLPAVGVWKGRRQEHWVQGIRAGAERHGQRCSGPPFLLLSPEPRQAPWDALSHILARVCVCVPSRAPLPARPDAGVFLAALLNPARLTRSIAGGFALFCLLVFKVWCPLSPSPLRQCEATATGRHFVTRNQTYQCFTIRLADSRTSKMKGLSLPRYPVLCHH